MGHRITGLCDTAVSLSLPVTQGWELGQELPASQDNHVSFPTVVLSPELSPQGGAGGPGLAVGVHLGSPWSPSSNHHPLLSLLGFFGFIILALLLVPMYYIPAGSFSGNPRRMLEDALDAFCQIGHRPLIALALLGNISSIAFFNFAGISVTKEISATTRMVLDSLRTLVIWAVSLALGWETFHGLEILGFGVLLTGAALYNGLHRPLLTLLPRRRGEEDAGAAEREGLLRGESTAINHGEN
ncbi:solute carrier family 35 member f6 [Limosa lapponica baueri]|uniref:Solute carrier family 35 member f6 n=1 Tax=Limosa lapponica baueri TaxID=1758121 RepID=A0A2I0T1Z4_LIMLA|nr:solute carrier family 35 member f6 [Limosa lapponica baueri]